MIGHYATHTRVHTAPTSVCPDCSAAPGAHCAQPDGRNTRIGYQVHASRYDLSLTYDTVDGVNVALQVDRGAWPARTVVYGYRTSEDGRPWAFRPAGIVWRDPHGSRYGYVMLAPHEDVTVVHGPTFARRADAIRHVVDTVRGASDARTIG